MAIIKHPRKNARCAKHQIPVTITVPINEMGNIYGERWFCKKCKGEPRKIIHSL